MNISVCRFPPPLDITLYAGKVAAIMAYLFLSRTIDRVKIVPLHEDIEDRENPPPEDTRHPQPAPRAPNGVPVFSRASY